MRISPALQEYADAWKFSTPATPYKRGYEDCLYSHIFACPHATGTPEYAAYCRGHEDARTAQHAERTQH